jgi:hypothetical protein
MSAAFAGWQAEDGKPAQTPLVGDADIASLESPVHNVSVLDLGEGNLTQVTWEPSADRPTSPRARC